MVQTLLAIGLVLTGLGVWSGYDALRVMPFDTSQPDAVVNLFAMHNRELSVLISAALFIAGVIFICTSMIVSRLNPPSGPA